MAQRENLPFDTRFFSKQTQADADVSAEERFRYIYRENLWAGTDSVSGAGSDNTQTAEISARLPQLLSDYNIRSLLDLPCGDFNWMKEVDLAEVQYIGGDIVQELVDTNTANYANGQRRFVRLDLLKDALPAVDLIFCRDCLVHLSNERVLAAIENIKKSRSKYLLTTTFTDCQTNEDIVTGDWRILNLAQTPFDFPQPVLLINEKCTEGNGSYADKCLGLWRIADL